MSEFGNYLKELRGTKSFREMERITGLSHTYLSTLEKGVDPRSGKERKPTPETLMQLSKTLNVSYSELMAAAGYLGNSEELLNDITSDNDELGKNYQQLKLYIEEFNDLVNKYQKNRQEITSRELHSDYKKKSLSDLKQTLERMNFLDIKIKENEKNSGLLSKKIEEKQKVYERMTEKEQQERIDKLFAEYEEELLSRITLDGINLEEILNSDIEITFNNRILSESEKQKVLQVLKITID